MPGAEPWRRGPRRAPGSPRDSDKAARRPPRPGEVALDAIAPDPFARLTLALMRWHFQTFVTPESQGWLMALRHATIHLGVSGAGPLCYDVVALVQALRNSRCTAVAFNPEGCACCRVWLTSPERQLLELLDALRGARTGRARATAQLLCDGDSGTELFGMAQIYVHRQAPEFSRAAETVAAPSARG